jgi:hypothetical protein
VLTPPTDVSGSQLALRSKITGSGQPGMSRKSPGRSLVIPASAMACRNGLSISPVEPRHAGTVLADHKRTREVDVWRRASLNAGIKAAVTPLSGNMAPGEPRSLFRIRATLPYYDCLGSGVAVTGPCRWGMMLGRAPISSSASAAPSASPGY